MYARYLFITAPLRRALYTARHLRTYGNVIDDGPRTDADDPWENSILAYYALYNIKI